MSELSVTMPTAKTVSAEKLSSADRDLMKRIASGDEAAFNQLVRRHGPALAQTIGRLTGWSRESDDILQEVFIAAWTKAGQFDGAGSLQGWLKRVAINQCRNQFRMTNSIQRKMRRFAEWLGGQQQHHHDQPIRRDLEEEVQSALARLSNNDRLVLVLFYLEEMSGDEVARALQVSARAVHVRLYRARKRMHKILNDERTESL